MVRIIANALRAKIESPFYIDVSGANNNEFVKVVPYKTKLLVWYLFLILFIENGTLGLIPKQFYMIYRSVRISDILIYLCIIYSLAYYKEYEYLFKSKSLIIVKILFTYITFQFIVSVVMYQQNLIEYIFRAKFLWYSFLIFPYLLLLKRGGFPYLVRLILPFAVLANILYIISALTGIQTLPDTFIVKTTVGGFEVYRVYGGTFYGDVFFLYYIYHWVTKKFELYQLFLAILFIIPQIIAFGRGAWAGMVFDIFVIILWNTMRKRNFRVILRQFTLMVLLFGSIFYGFMTFIPESDILTEALESRFVQGQTDIEYKEGSWGTRLEKNAILLELWNKSNFWFGVGLHPMWVIKPETLDEEMYYASICDVNWPAILAVYGVSGFFLACLCQVILLIISFKVIKKNKTVDINMFFSILLFCKLFFDSFIYYTTVLFTFTLWGFWLFNSFLIATTVYKYEELKNSK